MNPTLQVFIEDNIQMIEQRDWKGVYRRLADIDVYLIPHFTKMLLDLKEDPLEGMDYIPENFLRQMSITSFDIPSGIKTIGAAAFFHCDLKQIIIPEGVESIQGDAFENNKNLEYVKLPKSIQRIEQFAFSDCLNLKRVECDGTIDEFITDFKLSYNVFDNSGTNVIHCSDGDVALVNNTLSIYRN